MALRLIGNHHIEQWAGSIAARSSFPYWVRKLIQAVVDPHKLRMPHGDAVWIPGFDGVVFSNDTNPYVPTGASVWESGTNDDFRAKAKGDYDTRCVEKLGEDGKPKLVVNRPETTFIFVTPWIWPEKDKWENDRRAEGIWKDVRVIDGEDFKNWLESAPSVTLSFAAEILGWHTDGLWTAEQAWNDWSLLSVPPTSEEFVTAGREEQEKDVIRRLAGEPDTFTVRADSPREAWGFVLASIRRISSEMDRDNFLARTIVAEDEVVAGQLRNMANLIIVLKQMRGSVSGALARAGCHVILPEGNDYDARRNVVALGRPTFRQAADAIRKMILDDEYGDQVASQAERDARACGLSVTIFQRLKANANASRPTWAEEATARPLLPALLAGRWDAHNSADREILTQLADAPDYDAVIDQFSGFLSINEPPLRRVDEVWTLVAPVDAFQLIARHLRTADFKRFKTTFTQVFGRIDPKLEVDPDKRLYHTDDGTHSKWLRSGLAETLLLIAERGQDARIGTVNSKSFATEILRGIPGLGNDWRVLASIRDQYPKLMEAAPLPLLDSLEHLLKADPEGIRRLFADGSGVFAESMHTGILWGLETLAWAPEYLPRVVLILAKLAAIDPGGRLVNRPINSLKEIFLWWHVGTNAGLAQRLSAIDQVLDSQPEVGWTLLEKLLPQWMSSASFPTNTPRWREFGELAEDIRTEQGQLLYLGAIVDRALDRLGSVPERWHAVLDVLNQISPPQRERTVSLLEDLSRSGIQPSTRLSLWVMLRDLIARHRAFQDTEWALTHEMLDRLEVILASLAPADPVERLRWLFDESLPDLPGGYDDIEEGQKRADELRGQAIAEIMDSEGIPGLVRLGLSCKMPGLVALAAAPQLAELGNIRSFVDLAIAAGASGAVLAGQISGQAEKELGDSWRQHIRDEIRAGRWPALVASALVTRWPDDRATWDDIAAMGQEVEDEYWRRKHLFLIRGNLDDQVYQIDRLLAAGRAPEAFLSLAHHGKATPTEALLRVFDASISQLVGMQTADETRQSGIKSFDVSRFLDELRSRAEVSCEEMARREYRVLPLLGWRNARGLTLHELMANNPTFFVDVLCDVFLPASRDKNEDSEPLPEVRARAQAAYRLLEGMEILPGQEKDGSIDEQALTKWIVTVRTLATERDRAVVGDIKIGGILAHAPDDPDDEGWPHRVIRNVIGHFRSDDIERGLKIERYNMRGATWRAVHEGGVQERTLAAQYRKWADISRPNWPRMAGVLENIAAGWERDAEREDLRTEQDKLDLG